MEQVVNRSHVIQELQELLNRNIAVEDFPYRKGNSIRIGKYAIRKKQKEFIIIDCKTNKIIDQCFSQAAAIAVTKKLAAGVDVSLTEIKRLDQNLMKNYVDCIFYSHTIETTKDEFKRSATLDRYDIAKNRVEDATHALESHIFR
jgi:hypothetical protein|tara:strand:- start:13 stop:447 length:435 start_codon:yes stop_codon:yes gene_type:complete